jgi:hypothetical protein
MDKRTGKKIKQKKAPKVEDSTAISEKPPLAQQKKSPNKK